MLNLSRLCTFSMFLINVLLIMSMGGAEHLPGNELYIRNPLIQGAAWLRDLMPSEKYFFFGGGGG